MVEYFSTLWETSGLETPWPSGAWTAGLGWLHLGANLAICGASLAMTLVLAQLLLRRRDLPCQTVWWLLTLVLAAHGVLHFVESTLLWHPWYRFAGLVKLATAGVAWAAVLLMVRALPAAVRGPGRRGVERPQRVTGERQDADAQLRERAAELERMNQDLQSVSRLTLGREERIIELKREVNALLDEAGKPPRYPLRLEDNQLQGTGS